LEAKQTVKPSVNLLEAKQTVKPTANLLEAKQSIPLIASLRAKRSKLLNPLQTSRDCFIPRNDNTWFYDNSHNQTKSTPLKVLSSWYLFRK
ncbi:hypothetical protein, partial [Flavobacterium sp.]|uniref:hypothetical protein n=1 Tax=Flavobacterium sp. TaxID=239 RepID=UPI002FDB2C75